jgi:hypothetical protein
VRGQIAQRRSACENRPLRACRIASAVFASAALSVIAWNAGWPIERGWWLGAYLLLVGCGSQLLLCAGEFALATRRGTHPPSRVLAWSQLALWNLGTVTVAVADMARALAAVAVGSGMLMLSLALFLFGARPAGSVASREARRLERRYLALLLFLAGSVVVGTALAAGGQ